MQFEDTEELQFLTSHTLAFLNDDYMIHLFQMFDQEECYEAYDINETQQNMYYIITLREKTIWNPIHIGVCHSPTFTQLFCLFWMSNLRESQSLELDGYIYKGPFIRNQYRHNLKVVLDWLEQSRTLVSHYYKGSTLHIKLYCDFLDAYVTNADKVLDVCLCLEKNERI